MNNQGRESLESATAVESGQTMPVETSSGPGHLYQEIQVLAHHPLAARYVLDVLSSCRELCPLLARPPISDFNLLAKGTSPRLFVLDTSLLPLELSNVTRHVTLYCPDSKFLGLLPARRCEDEDILRMLYLGFDGLVRIAEGLEEELVTAVKAILAGELWAPRRVLAEYVRQTNWLRSDQLLSRFSLTARETQVLQLALRRLTNKEIAAILGISECTVKFHVSNIFGNLRLDGRQSLPVAIDDTLGGLPSPEPVLVPSYAIS